ncbi:MAG: 7-cyano-7-deazaguanine synthase QueC [Bdellovibrionota bacterium]
MSSVYTERQPRPVLVILSGGQDSATCLYWAKKQFLGPLHAITFDYGQRHRVELECAATLAADAGATHVLIPVNSLSALSSNALTDSSVAVAGNTGMNGLPSTFVPGRNALFLTLAAAYAVPKGIKDLVIGACQMDAAGYPDCRDGFMKSMQHALSMAMESPVNIHTPLMYLTKDQTFRLAEKLGVLEKVVTGTHTCYEGNHSDLHTWGYGCGKCPACDLRRKGYEDFLERSAATR